ncbi:unnamed protein product, partial [Polarella glacialis]
MAGTLETSATFELPAASLRVFQRAVACLSKLGREAAVIFRAEELVLFGADDGHSAAIQFAFRRKFFRATPASSAVAGFTSQVVQSQTVVVGARALMVALRGSQQRG